MTRSYVEILLAHEIYLQYLSFCIGNFYFWQALTTIGFCHYLRRLADKFPTPPIIAIDSPVEVGPSMQQLLEEKETALTDAASKIDNFDRETACLRAKVRRLESEVDFLSSDRYTLVREKIILENRLGDFNSWPEFRIEFDHLTTELIAIKMQRAREHVLQERYLAIARETRVELAAAKEAITMSKTAHSKELELVQQERDQAMEKYRILLATTTTTAAATTPTATPAAVAANTSLITNAAASIPVVKGDSPEEIALKNENTRLILALRSQTSLLSQKYSDLDRMQSRQKTRSDHFAALLNRASLAIASLEEDKAKAEARIEELGRNFQEAKDRADEIEEMYMAVAFMSEGKGEKVEKKEEQREKVEEKEEEGEKVEEKEEEGEKVEEKEEEGEKVEEEKVEAKEEEGEEEGSGEKAETSGLLKQIVETSNKGPAGGSGADGSGSEDQDEDEDEDANKDEDMDMDEEEEKEGDDDDENEDGDENDDEDEDKDEDEDEEEEEEEEEEEGEEEEEEGDDDDENDDGDSDSDDGDSDSDDDDNDDDDDSDGNDDGDGNDEGEGGDDDEEMEDYDDDGDGNEEEEHRGDEGEYDEGGEDKIMHG